MKRARTDFTGLMTAISVVILAIVAIALGIMLFRPVPNENRELVSLILGAILGSLGTVVAFFFGSSKSSRDKDEAMLNANRNPEDPQP